MAVVLERSVEPWMMCIRPLQLVSPVQIHSVSVKEYAVSKVHHVHIDGHEHWKKKQRQGPKKLIDPLISDDRKRAWIVEDVVMFVLNPTEFGRVAEPVVVKFKEIRADEDQKEREDMISNAVFRETAVCLRVSTLGKVKRKGRTKRCHDDSLHSLDNLLTDLLSRGISRISFRSPYFVCGLPIVEFEDNARHAHNQYKRETR